MHSVLGTVALATIAFSSLSIAHPGHDIAAEVAERAPLLARMPNVQTKCKKRMEASGYNKRAVERRQALVDEERARRSISNDSPYLTHRSVHARSLDSVLATDHNMTLQYLNDSVTLTSSQDMFFGDNSSCILLPETDIAEGPYYVTGEFVRKNLTENQPGVPMTLDVQIIDINTCDPVPDVYVEFWEANYAGIYSGTSGNDNDDGDPTNVNSTFLRGFQKTDDDGVVQVYTLFPGHYTPRAPHTHFIVHEGGFVRPNGTFAGGNISHVGQLFWDQDLIDLVYDNVYPYTTNNDTLMLNSEDMVLSGEAAYGADPIARYSYVGDEVTDGIVSWITVGINTTEVETVIAAAWYGSNGGIENPNAYTPGAQVKRALETKVAPALAVFTAT